MVALAATMISIPTFSYSQERWPKRAYLKVATTISDAFRWAKRKAIHEKEIAKTGLKRVRGVALSPEERDQYPLFKKRVLYSMGVVAAAGGATGIGWFFRKSLFLRPEGKPYSATPGATIPDHIGTTAPAEQLPPMPNDDAAGYDANNLAAAQRTPPPPTAEDLQAASKAAAALIPPSPPAEDYDEEEKPGSQSTTESAAPLPPKEQGTSSTTKGTLPTMLQIQPVESPMQQAKMAKIKEIEQKSPVADAPLQATLREVPESSRQASSSSAAPPPPPPPPPVVKSIASTSHKMTGETIASAKESLKVTPTRPPAKRTSAHGFTLTTLQSQRAALKRTSSTTSRASSAPSQQLPEATTVEAKKIRNETENIQEDNERLLRENQKLARILARKQKQRNQKHAVAAAASTATTLKGGGVPKSAAPAAETPEHTPKKHDTKPKEPPKPKFECDANGVPKPPPPPPPLPTTNRSNTGTSAASANTPATEDGTHTATSAPELPTFDPATVKGQLQPAARRTLAPPPSPAAPAFDPAAVKAQLKPVTDRDHEHAQSPRSEQQEIERMRSSNGAMQRAEQKRKREEEEEAARSSTNANYDEESSDDEWDEGRPDGYEDCKLNGASDALNNPQLLAAYQAPTLSSASSSSATAKQEPPEDSSGKEEEEENAQSKQ